MGIDPISIEIIGAIVFAASASAMSMLAGMAQQASARRRQKSAIEQLRESARGHLINAEEPDRYLPLVYGKMRVGINTVFREVGGSNNDYLHIIGNLCEGEIEGIVQEGGVYQVFFDDKLYTQWGSYAYFEAFNGAADQSVCSTLRDALGYEEGGPYYRWNEPKKHTAYLYLRLTYDQDKFQTVPEITAVIKGLKVYDPRSSQTVWSENPALIIRDMLVRSSKRGGFGIDASRIDDASFIAAANYCDTKGWTACGYFTGDTPIVDFIARVEAAGRLRLVFSDNKFKLRYLDMNYETSSGTISEFIADGNGVATLRVHEPHISDIPNIIRARWCDPANRWQFVEYVFPDPDAIEAEGGERPEDLDLSCVSNLANVQKLTYYELERRRVCREITFSGLRECMKYEPYDLVRITHAPFGWNQKWFRIMSNEVTNEGICNISAVEEFLSFYDDAYNVETPAYYETSLPHYLSAVPSVINVSWAEETYVHADKTYVRLKIQFDPPPAASYPWYKHTEIWVKRGSGDYVFQSITTSDFVLDPVQEGLQYTVKMVNVSIFETKENFAAAYSIQTTIVGKSTYPTAVASLVAIPSGDSINLIASNVTGEADIDGYEIRWGDTWDAGIFLAYTKAAQIRLTGVRPGIHRFWIATKDNRGRYSSTKRDASCEVFYPANYADKNTWNWDFTSGDHDGTIYDYYSSSDCLRVSKGNIARNGNFDSNVSQFTAVGADLAWDSGGYAGGCMKVTASADGGYGCQDIFVKAGRSYTLKFRYRNTSGDVAQYSIYDLTNSAYIKAVTDLQNSETWSSEQTWPFTAPSGCKKVRIAFHGKLNGDIVFFDSVSLEDANAVLSGTWTSPEYDLGSVKKCRYWGDFQTLFTASNMTWNGIIPPPVTWEQIGIATKRWMEIFQPTAAAQLEAKIKYGTVSGQLTNEFTRFQMTAPEFEARYVKVVVTITDPTVDSALYLRRLNMKAAFWQ